MFVGTVRSVLDFGTEKSLHIRVIQRKGKIQWCIWDPGTFYSDGGEHQLEQMLVKALLEDKQFLAGMSVIFSIRTVIFPIRSS